MKLFKRKLSYEKIRFYSMEIFVIVYRINLTMSLFDMHQLYWLKFEVDLIFSLINLKVFAFSFSDIQSNFIIHFDPLTFRIYIKLQPTFVNRVRGLCGTFNYITNDDFLTPNNVIETNLVTFANAYLTSACSVPDQQTDTCLNFPVVWFLCFCVARKRETVF